MNYLTVVLDSRHRKNEFSCGKKMLDDYLYRQANQDLKRKLSLCFVLEEGETGLIKGYYTLANAGIPLRLLPAVVQRKLPKSYSLIPVTLLGRLAVDQNFHGKGIGKLLLIDALKRSHDAAKNIGSFAVVVDPLDAQARSYYEKYGFINLPDSGKMFLSMKTIKRLFEP